jgi:osmotically inducible protein OsmC
MSKIEKVLATGKTHTTLSGADTTLRGHNGNLDIVLSSPGIPLAGPRFRRDPTASESRATVRRGLVGLLHRAVGLVAAERNIALPADLAVDIEVDLGQTGPAYFLQARLTLRVPGLAHDVATELAHIADSICPYSKATRGNIDVALNVITA